MKRSDSRTNDQLRKVKIIPNYLAHPAGSALIDIGGTKVICAVSFEPGVPPWMRAQGVPGGWVTCEYGLLPSSTHQRNQREASKGKQSGRLQLAFRNLMERRQIQTFPMRENVAAVSVGMKNGECLLDLCYEEDSSADVDMNVVMTESGRIVEVQGTAEEKPFTRAELDAMLNLAKRGLDRLFEEQRRAVGDEALPKPSPKNFGNLGSVLDKALR